MKHTKGRINFKNEVGFDLQLVCLYSSYQFWDNLILGFLSCLNSQFRIESQTRQWYILVSVPQPIMF